MFAAFKSSLDKKITNINEENQKSYVVYIGSLTRWQGIDTLLEAINLTDPLKLIYKKAKNMNNFVEIRRLEDQNTDFSLLEAANDDSRRAYLSVGC